MKKSLLTLSILLATLWGPMAWSEDGAPIPMPVPQGQVSVGGPVSPDGSVVIVVDLPLEQRIHNIGSHLDGAGMCVTSSVEMAARYQNLEQLRGFRDWAASHYPGGDSAGSLEAKFKRYCQEKNLDPASVSHFSYEGPDIAVVQLFLKTYRAVAVTYGGMDGVRYRGRIYHMVLCIYCDDRWTCLLDNNEIEDNKFLWMPTPEFVTRWYEGGSTGWAVGFFAPPPPPIPNESPNLRRP